MKYAPLDLWSLANFIKDSMCAVAFSSSTANAAAHSGPLKCRLRAWDVENFVHGGLKMTSTALVSTMRLLAPRWTAGSDRSKSVLR